ncbi:MAG: POTRA domain-containing protein [Bacteroidales bacterium]
MRKYSVFLILIISLASRGYAVTDSLIFIRKITLLGNHITRDYILYRELVFKVGDSLSPENFELKLKKSTENLMNISLFNFVTISPIITENKASIAINVTERWYIWPIPQFDLADRNFNTWWKTQDFKRVNYGVDLNIYNFRGRNETVDFLLSLGYDEKYGISYKIPYINKKQTLGLILMADYARNHEVAVNTRNNKIEFFKDPAYYPKQSIALGGGITYRRNIHNSHLLQLSYEAYRFSDTLLRLNPSYSNSQQLNTAYLTFYYQFKNDYRDYKPYPLIGHYFDVEISKSGLGFLSTTPEYPDFFSLKSTYRRFWKLSSQFYDAFGITLAFTPEYPYYIQNGLGFGRDYVRGYEYYVINGQGFGLLKTNFKYALLTQKVSKLNFIKTEKFNTIPYSFYMNFFVDAAYVYNKEKDSYNSLTNSLLLGTGIGIDFVTYYDKVLRVEYSFNKKGESGFFIHFMTSI